MHTIGSFEHIMNELLSFYSLHLQMQLGSLPSLNSKAVLDLSRVVPVDGMHVEAAVPVQPDE